METTFQQRLIEAMEKREVTQTELARLTGLSKPRISQYVNGVYEAKSQALYKLSKALNVNVAWLMGHDVPFDRSPDEELIEKKTEAIQHIKNYFGEDSVKFIELFIHLDVLDRGRILGKMEEMLEDTKYISKKSDDKQAI